MAAADVARFAVKLDDETSGPANAAAGALDKMRQKIEADQKALSNLQKAMRGMQQGAVVNVQAFKQLQTQIEQKKSAISGMTADFLALGGSFAKMPKPKAIPKATADLEALARETKKLGLGGPDAIMDLVGALGTIPGAALTGVAAIGALSVAVVGLTVGGLVGLVKMAISSQEALEGMSQEAINVAKRTPIARDKVSALADELAKTGLKGEALEAALEKALVKKYGKEAQKSMLGLTVQLNKAKENIALLFTGVRTGPLLEAVSKLLSFLDASTVEGSALKLLIETILNPLIDGIGKAGPAAKQFFQGMIIGALQAAIAILRVKKRLEDAIGLKVDLKAIDWTMLGQAVVFAAVAIGAFVVAIGVVAGIVLGSVAAVALLGVAFGILIGKVVEAVVEIPGALSSIHNFIVSRVAAMIDAGREFVSGLAQGIMNGLSEVVSAAKTVAKGAVDAVKGELKIKSPSQVMIEAGNRTAEGMAVGMDQGAGDVAASGRALASIPSETAGEAKGGAGGGRGDVVINLAAGAIVVSGVEGADDPEFVHKIADAFEAALLQAGIVVPS